MVLSLEWACTFCLMWACLTRGRRGWKEGAETSLGDGARVARAYISNRMRNPLAAIGNVSHLAMPLALYASKQRLTGEARLEYLAGLLALPGFLLYLHVTWELLRAHLSS